MLFDMLFSPDRPSFAELIFTFLSYAMILLVALPVHELAHAYTADRMGDQTARWNGRLTMNPFAHLDIFGSLLIFLAGFGYAKPVPVNPRNFRDYNKGMILTSLAGPLSNLVMAFLSLAILKLITMFSLSLEVRGIVSLFFDTFSYINIILAVFNLFPIPPLDGYRVISNFLPPRWVFMIEQYQRYITIIFFVLVISNRFGGILTGIAFPIYRLFSIVLGL